MRSLFLLALLTLLQGIAPLLHAHIDGQFVRTGAHLHLAMSAGASAGAAAIAGFKPSARGENFFQSDEMPEVGVTQVIERRLLLLAAADDPVLPSVVVAVPSSGAGKLPLLCGDDRVVHTHRNSSCPPPATAPPILLV